MIIREARGEELDYVRAAYRDWDYHGGVEPGDVVLIAESGARLLGLVRCTHECETVMLRGMQVAPDARGQGVGTQLLAAFVERLAGQECYCVPYTHLLAFYAKAGFKLQTPDDAPRFLSDRLTKYRAEGLDVILMRRPAIYGTPDRRPDCS